MADLKKLIGNALNKAKSTKPSDDGYATRKVKGMTPKQGMNYKQKESVREGYGKRLNEIKSNTNELEKFRTSFNDKKPGYNYNAPASTKTPKPEAMGGYKKPVTPTAPVKAKKQNFNERYEANMSMTRKAMGELNKMTSDLNKADKKRQREQKLGGFTPSIGKEIQANQKESLKYKKY